MAQPLHSWQAFQHEYAKTNKGSTKQQVAQEWRKYKEQHGVTKTSPKRIEKSPSKKSPSYANIVVKKSPKKTEMHRLAGATLTNLPPGVGEMISRLLPDKSIAALQTTSKRTKHITQQRLDELCRELPTSKEIVSHIRELLASPNFAVSFLRPLSEDEEELRGAYLSFFSQNAIFKFRSYKAVHDFMSWNEFYPFRSSLDEFEAPYVDPNTLLNILEKRLGCKKQQYYNMVIEYTHNVMRPVLQLFLSEEQIASVFQGEQIPNLVIVVPPFEGVLDRNEYLRRVFRLHFARVWLLNTPNNIDMTVTRAEDVHIPFVIAEQVEGIAGFFRTWLANRLSGMYEHIYVTSSEVIAYIQDKINSKKHARIALYTNQPVLHLGAYYSVKEITIQNGRITTVERKYSEPFRREDRLIVRDTGEIEVEAESGEKDLAMWLKYKSFFGIVDPATALSIIREKGHASPHCDAECADGLIRDRIRSLIKDVLHSLSIDSALIPSAFFSRILAKKIQIPAHIKSIAIPQLLLIARWLGLSGPLLESIEKEVPIPDKNADKRFKEVLSVLANY